MNISNPKILNYINLFTPKPTKTSNYSSVIVLYKNSYNILLSEIIKVPKAAVPAASLAINLLLSKNATIIIPAPIPINPILKPANQPAM